MAERVSVNGHRGEVLAYIAAHMERLDSTAVTTDTPRPGDYRDPLERLQHMEGLLRTIRAGVQADPGKVPSPHFLRALASQVCAWLEAEHKLGRVSW